MKLIPSFQIDHEILKRGIYISRIDDDITTYDIRMKEPNREPVLTNSALHTIEHLFATYVRNTEFGDNIIYFGPMGFSTLQTFGELFPVQHQRNAEIIKSIICFRLRKKLSSSSR